MSSSYKQCSLFLHPAKHRIAPEDIPQLISALKEIGFISNNIKGQSQNNFFTGKHFLNYIAYMGCAPAIQFAVSENNENFCYIQIHQYETAELIYSKVQSRAPHCPHCKKPVKDWQQHKSGSIISCNQCNTSSDIEDYNWHKMAGYSQLFIEITDVFPKEAIPQQTLLDELAGITDTAWQFFYSCR